MTPERADDVRDSMPLFRSGRGGSTPTSALHLTVAKCSVHRAVELNAEWHSRLPAIHWSNIVRATPCICFVAEHDDIAYASAIWSAPVARQLNGRNWLELRRLAIADDAPKNTATRMLRIMRMIIAKELPEVVHLISYQDTAVHSGTIYKAAGWTAAYTSKLPRWDKGAGRTKQRTSPVADGVKVRWELSLLNTQAD